MYHDDREITADQLITTLDSEVMKLTDLAEDARLLLMVVVVSTIGLPASSKSDLNQRLLEDPALKGIKINTLKSLLSLASQLITSDVDALYLINHLTARLIARRLDIDYRHPKLIAALVGTIQSTLSTPLFEAMPNTAELSLGLLGMGPKASFPLSAHIAEWQRDLIALRLRTHDVQATFITPEQHLFQPQTTFLFDAAVPNSSLLQIELRRLLSVHVQGRLILIQNWSKIDNAKGWSQLQTLIESRAHIEALINFSSLPAPSDHCTAIIINTEPFHRETLYVDVTMANTSLPPLDGIERMLLAGCIYNLWQGRPPHRSIEYLSSGVSRFVNSYFRDGFRPINGLCNAVDKRPKSISKTQRASRQFLVPPANGLEQPTLSSNSKLISEALMQHQSPCCIYVIGNNGEGKSMLLRDIVYQRAEARKICIGLPMSHVDRFPVGDPSVKRFFFYKGARKTPIIKELGKISSQPSKVKLLRECLELIGFGTKIYFMLKSELSHDQRGQRRRDELDLMVERDMQYLNRDRDSIGKYEVNFVREQHRTTPFDNLSSGEQSILSLLIRIIASDAEGTTFLIDEPEISLHVSWQQILPRILSQLSEALNASFVVATHSPVLIANAAEHDLCYVSRVGKLALIPVAERHSVETLLMDGFETYTPHNREVHERCAKLVASLISAANDNSTTTQTAEAIDKLEAFRATIRRNAQLDNDKRNDDKRRDNDLDLIEKTLGAIKMLRDQSEPYRA